MDPTAHPTPTTPAPELTALDWERIRTAVLIADDEQPSEGWDDVLRQIDAALAAAERPAEGNTVTIDPTTLAAKAYQEGRASAVNDDRRADELHKEVMAQVRALESRLAAAERPADDDWPVSMASIRQAIRWTSCIDVAKYPWDEEDERAAAELLSALAASSAPADAALGHGEGTE